MSENKSYKTPIYAKKWEVIEEGSETESITKEDVKKGSFGFVIGAIVATLIVLVAVFGFNAFNNEATHEVITDDAVVEQVHTHTWQPVYEKQHFDEVNHEVVHEAMYETLMVPHTVCNVCHEIIDGKTSEHKSETDHIGFTTSVPTPEQKLVSEEWTETVVDEPARDEMVEISKVCLVCGETAIVPVVIEE